MPSLFKRFRLSIQTRRSSRGNPAKSQAIDTTSPVSLLDFPGGRLFAESSSPKETIQCESASEIVNETSEDRNIVWTCEAAELDECPPKQQVTAPTETEALERYYPGSSPASTMTEDFTFQSEGLTVYHDVSEETVPKPQRMKDVEENLEVAESHDTVENIEESNKENDDALKRSVESQETRKPLEKIVLEHPEQRPLLHPFREDATEERQQVEPGSPYSTISATHTNEPNAENGTAILKAFPYASPSEVPAKSDWLLGKRVKVKSSLKDAKKRNQIGTVLHWKTKSTVELQCENSKEFGVRLANIEFVDTGNSVITSATKQPGPVAQTAPAGERAEQPPDLPDLGKAPGKHSSVSANSEESLVVETEERRNQNLYLVNSIHVERDAGSETTLGEPAESTGQSPTSTANPGPSSVQPIQYSTHVEASTEVNRDVHSAHDTAEIPITVSDSIISDGTPPLYKFPSEVTAKCESIIGKRVKVKDSLTDRKKRGAKGVVLEWKTKNTMMIQCDDGKKFGVRLDSLEFLLGGAVTAENTVVETTSSPKTSNPSPRARNVAPKNSNRSPGRRKVIRNIGRATRSVARSIASPRARRSTARKAKSSILKEKNSKKGAAFRAPSDSKEATSFGGQRVVEIVLQDPDDVTKTEISMFDHILSDRKRSVRVKMNGKKNQKPLLRTLRESNETYEIVSSKIDEDNASGHSFSKAKEAKLVYARTKSDDDDDFSVKEYLERIGDFSRLNPRKCVSRLELLQSPSELDIVFLDESEIKEIPDRGYVGGGFIQEDKLLSVLETAGMTNKAAAQRVIAIQVRLFIPSKGVFKGMLVKKRSTDAPPIELPWSMKKVPKSTHPNPIKGVALVICKYKLHPSSGSANEYIGRKLDPSLNPPPEKGFQQKITKQMSPMVFQLWRTMGVPEKVYKKYGKESLKPERRNHAWVVGVPDMTNALPPDTVFLTGMNKDPNAKEFFVTRSPCYANEHGRKFKVLRTKPDSMSVEDWEFINNLPFGALIFSNPREGMKSIPERIANGDLDGDLYLVCWDKEIVSHMISVPLKDEKADDDGKLSTFPSNPNWLKAAQDIIVDVGRINEVGNLLGKLYRLGEKCANNSPDCLKNPDANAYFEAFNQALEYKKHGRPIRLPARLIAKLPENQRHLLEPSY